MRVLVSSTNFSETFFILRISERDIITNVQGVYVKNPLFCQILMKAKFPPKYFRKIVQKSNHTKIVPGVADLFHSDGGTVGLTDRQTVMTKMIVAFFQFCKRA
jgi:hypothetical protein